MTAKFFRIELDGAGLLPAAVIHGRVRSRRRFPRRSIRLGVSEAIFYSDARVNRWEDKGAFGSLMDLYDVVPTPVRRRRRRLPRRRGRSDHKMDKDGTLHWDVPEGTGRFCAWAIR